MYIFANSFAVILSILYVVKALPQSQASTSSVAAPASTSVVERQKGLFKELFTSGTTVSRFQKLLAPGGVLLDSSAIGGLTVFNFQGAVPANGAKGGATKAAVCYTLWLLHLCRE